MPLPVASRRACGTPLLAAALLALTAGSADAAAPVAGTGVLLDASASLAQRGWVPQSSTTPPVRQVTDWRNYPVRAEWKYDEYLPNNTITQHFFAGAYARSDSVNSGTADASVAIGASAIARAIATAAGSASASARATWEVVVVINPFQNAGQFGMPMYLRLLERFGCDNTGQCGGVDFDTRFQHVSTGRFAHSVQPFHQGVASYSESVTIAGGAGFNATSATLAGAATYRAVQSPTTNNLEAEVSPTIGWTDDDFIAFGPTSGRLLSLYPPQATLDNIDDPNGPLAGERLFALREATVTSQFRFSPFPEISPYLLPSTGYQVSIEQIATAGFSGGYGWGTVAADFDNTARTSVLALVDPTGELELDPSMLQVFMRPVPEPSTVRWLACALVVIALGSRRWRPRVAR